MASFSFSVCARQERSERELVYVCVCVRACGEDSMVVAA